MNLPYLLLPLYLVPPCSPMFTNEAFPRNQNGGRKVKWKERIVIKRIIIKRDRQTGFYIVCSEEGEGGGGRFFSVPRHVKKETVIGRLFLWLFVFFK